VGIFANNLTDKTTAVGVLDQYVGSTGTVGLTYNEPRMYGLRVGYRFGE
jgi:iron complex outermembrane receptor protein